MLPPLTPSKGKIVGNAIFNILGINETRLSWRFVRNQIRRSCFFLPFKSDHCESYKLLDGIQ